MKHFFTLFLCGLAAVLISCKDDDAQTPPRTVTSQVSGTTVTVTSTTDFGAGQITTANSGFVYMPLDDPEAFLVASDPTINGNVMSCTLKGLSAETIYVVYAFVELPSGRVQGESAAFQTGKGSDSPDPGPDPGPDPDPDPDPNPNPSDAKYAGWAELPNETTNSDYHYAYHLCPDVYVPGTNNQQKRRNYGVCFSASLKCAIWVAAPMHDCYAVKNTDRTDAYKPDPDIQVSQAPKWSGYTRGHMLGSAERLVSNQTNRQVFYLSNIAPQLGQPYFNTGGGAWNTLEDWIDTQWMGQSDTTYQVIGCYWDKNGTKKVVSGTTIPTHFYKVLLRTKGHKNKWVVNCSRDELQCVAIMIQHKTYSKSEVPQPSQYAAKGLLHSVREIEQMTGQTFFPNVPNAPKDNYNADDWGL